MNAPASSEINPIIGTAMGGGFYADRIRIAGQLYALIVAPKAEGQIKLPWINDYKAVPGAMSYCDGLANTEAMAVEGSELARWAKGLTIAGHADWYIPSQDELEVIYRNLKPTTEKNYCYARSGINLHAAEPTLPYKPDFPLQTSAELFQAGGAEAFDPHLYWSSTQHASYSDYAWTQDFDYGGQFDYSDYQLRARAVRRLVIE